MRKQTTKRSSSVGLFFKKILLSIIAVGLICVLLTGMVPTSETILPTRTQTDYDASYPLDITPVVNPDSVCFLPLESPESLLPILDFNGAMHQIGTLSNSDLPDGEQVEMRF